MECLAAIWNSATSSQARAKPARIGRFSTNYIYQTNVGYSMNARATQTGANPQTTRQNFIDAEIAKAGKQVGIHPLPDLPRHRHYRSVIRWQALDVLPRLQRHRHGVIRGGDDLMPRKYAGQQHLEEVLDLAQKLRTDSELRSNIRAKTDNLHGFYNAVTLLESRAQRTKDG